MKGESITLFDNFQGAPYEERQQVQESFGDFLDFVERCARVYGSDEREGFDKIIEQIGRPSRWGGNDIGDLY